MAKQQISDDTKNYYLSENYEEIKEKIKESTKENPITDSTDIVSVMTNVFESNIMLGVYDSKTHKRISQNEELRYLANIGIEKTNKPFSNKIIDEYLEILENKVNEDISEYTSEQVLELIKENNIAFFRYYATAIQPSLFDLYDKTAQTSYAMKILNYLMELQQVEIEKIGYKDFSELDLEKDTNNFDRYFSIQTLKLIQEDIKEPINQDELDFSSFESISKYIQDLTYTKIMTNELEKIEKRLEEEVKSKRVFYKERHDKFLKIEKLLQKIKEKYEGRLNIIAEQNKISDSEKVLYKNIITDNFQIIDHRLQKNFSSIESNIEQPVDLKLVNKKNKKGIKSTPINVLLDIADTSLYGNYLDEFDLEVWDISFNLYQAGNKQLTPELIYKEFTGKTPNNMGSELYNSILKSLHKLSITRIKLTLAEETKKALNWDNELIEKISIIDYALPLREMEIEYTNHTKKMCFVYLSEPTYFLFSRSLGQIKTIDRELLALDTGSSLNRERVIIKSRLAKEFKRIESTIGTELENNKISYESFFDKCGIFKELDKEIESTTDSDSIRKLKNKRKTYKNRYTEVIKEVLEYWKKEGFIKDYKEYISKKNGRGIELIGVKKRNIKRATK